MSHESTPVVAEPFPTTHTLVYADYGAGKSTFASTYPKPMLVWLFDAHGKDFPYRKRWPDEEMLPQTEIQEYEVLSAIGAAKQPYRDISDTDGLIRIEYFHDEIGAKPMAMPLVYGRLAMLDAEIKAGMWKTLVVETATSLEMAARKQEEKVLNPSAKDKRQWFGGGVDAVEEIVVWRFAGLAINIVLVCHISQEKNEVSGEILRGPSVRGRLSKGGIIGAYYQEIYHLYTQRDEQGVVNRLVQTQNRDGFAATTQIKASDPCYPHYLSLWETFR